MSLPADDTGECFSYCIGKTVVGVLHDISAPRSKDVIVHTKTLVFDDWTGLTITRMGHFWIESEKDVRRAVALKQKELDKSRDEINYILKHMGDCK